MVDEEVNDVIDNPICYYSYTSYWPWVVNILS